MEITLHSITVRELIDGFEDNEEEGVVGYGGLLNIRPKYQREFIYSDRQQKEVIYSIFKGFPLNVIYWVKNDDGTFELLDGQQRTLSICAFAKGELFIKINGNDKHYGSLTPDQRQRFLDYRLQVYVCENGTDSEKLDWFQIINVAGEKLTPQELRNAVYCGPWVTAAKRRFSKTGCVAYRIAQNYMNGTPIRQDYLEKALEWISGGDIEKYMATHQHDTNADAEWQYFQKVISWVQILFPRYRREMKGQPWGAYYNKYKDNIYSATDLEERLTLLMTDDDVTSKRGVYEYLLSGDERSLNIRAFTPAMKREAYERQKGVCPHCGKHFEIEEMEGDHITPWCEGGKTNAANLMMLCRDCNRRKGGK